MSDAVACPPVTAAVSPGLGLRRLVGGSMIYALTRALLSGSRFLLIPLYVRYLVPEQYGIVGTAGTVATVLTVICSAGMERAVAREYFDYRDDPIALRSYFFTVYVFLFAVNLVAAGASIAAGPFLVSRAFPKGELPFYPYLLLAVAIAAVTSFYAVFMVTFQAREQPRAYAAAQTARFVAMIGATLLFLVWWRMAALGVLLGELVATSGAAIVLGAIQVRSLAAVPAGEAHARFNPRMLRAAIAYGLPFIPYEVTAWIMSGADRLILTRLRSLDEVGVYTLAMTLALGLNIVTVGLNLAFSPYFFRVAQEHEGAGPPPALARLIELFVFAVGAACLFGMLFARELLTLMSNARYAGAERILPILLFSAFAAGMYSLVILPILQQKRTTRLPAIVVAGAVLNVAWNLLLVPRFGVDAAAWGNLAANVVAFCLAFQAASAVLRLPYDRLAFWGVLALVAVAGFSLRGAPLEWRAAGFVVALGLMTFANRRTIALVRGEVAIQQR